jgi:2-hydroxychromene-2-carboxylate isomerase
VLCGGIFQAIDNPGPLVIPAKRDWIMGDYVMWAQHYGVAFALNPHAPVRTLPLMRGAFVAEERGELARYLKALFEAIWVDARNLSDADEVRQTLEGAGLDPDAYFTGIERADVKDRLRQNTDDAVARGVFGVPTFFVGERMFFGQDRLEFVKRALRED